MRKMREMKVAVSQVTGVYLADLNIVGLSADNCPMNFLSLGAVGFCHKPIRKGDILYTAMAVLPDIVVEDQEKGAADTDPDKGSVNENPDKLSFPY